jgi:peptide/nickel transport system ATP-binding protein
VGGLAARYGKAHRSRLARLRPGTAPSVGEDLVIRDVSFAVGEGESVGLVGESGSGKTTVGLCLVGLLPLAAGEISYAGTVVGRGGELAAPPRVRGVQAVYQDPQSALNPRRSVGSLIREVLHVHGLPRARCEARCVELLEMVGLPGSTAARRSRELSGGMCQRVAIARALALEPRLLVADEVVSALDASVQAQVLNLLDDLRAGLGLGVLLITHDLAVLHQSCQRVLVMSAGEIVEHGATAEVLRAPQHEYTRSLIAAVPSLDSARGGREAA